MSDLIALEYARANQQRSLERLFKLLRFPTISSLFPANRADFEACADWLVEILRAMGFQRAQRYATGGPDVVYAEWLGADGAPTLLIYGHYDVMPVEPVEEWKHPPFEPVVDGERIYARGASDDKGQFFALLCAAEAWIQTGGLPVNLKILLEGEEEELSPHLGQFIRQNRDLLRCDGIVIADMGGLHPMVPIIEYGTRGNCALEITITGAARDLHSALTAARWITPSTSSFACWRKFRMEKRAKSSFLAFMTACKNSPRASRPWPTKSPSAMRPPCS